MAIPKQLNGTEHKTRVPVWARTTPATTRAATPATSLPFEQVDHCTMETDAKHRVRSAVVGAVVSPWNGLCRGNLIPVVGSMLGLATGLVMSPVMAAVRAARGAITVVTLDEKSLRQDPERYKQALNDADGLVKSGLEAWNLAQQAAAQGAPGVRSNGLGLVTILDHVKMGQHTLSGEVTSDHMRLQLDPNAEPVEAGIGEFQGQKVLVFENTSKRAMVDRQNGQILAYAESNAPEVETFFGPFAAFVGFSLDPDNQ